MSISLFTIGYEGVVIKDFIETLRSFNIKALEQARGIAYEGRACLLCFERDHSSCHRDIVAEEMRDHEINEICHLDVESGEVYVNARN